MLRLDQPIDPQETRDLGGYLSTYRPIRNTQTALWEESPPGLPTTKTDLLPPTIPFVGFGCEDTRLPPEKGLNQPSKLPLEPEDQ